MGNVAFYIVVLSGSERSASECLIGKSSRKTMKNVIVRLNSNSKKQEEHTNDCGIQEPARNKA